MTTLPASSVLRTHASAIGWTIFVLLSGTLLVCSSAVTQTIVVMLAWHGVILALPFIAAVVDAIHRGIDDPILLALWGGTVSGVCAYLSFWCLFFDPVFAHVLLLSALIATLAVGWRSGSRLTISQRQTCKQFLLPFGLCLVYAAVLLIVAISPSGAIDQPLEIARSRFSHALPFDNELPFLFAKNVLANNYQSPMFGDWLGSDRPPLQSGYFLASTLGLSQLPWSWLQEELSYQIQSTLLQTFWLAGLWILLNSMKLRRDAIIGAVAICAFSGFAFVHGIFVWPKLLPVFSLALIAGFVFNSDRAKLLDARIGALLGCNAALAILCHGGSFFALAGLGLYALITRKIPSAKFLIAAILVGLAMLLPWSLYQHYFDPPGDRLLKWHLAGVIDIDARPLSIAFQDAYRTMTLKEFFSTKLSQISAMAGFSWDWPWLQVKALSLQLSGPDAVQLRGGQFYSLAAVLGFFSWAPLLFFFGRRFAFNAEFVAAKKLLSLSALIVVVWTCAMYERGATTIHQGSLAVVMFALTGCFLFCFAWRPLVAWLLLFCQLLVSISLYIPLAEREGFSNSRFLLLPISDGAFVVSWLLIPVFFLVRRDVNKFRNTARSRF